MPTRPSSHPTEAELEALAVLWRRGPSTVRQVHEALQADRTTSLTTTLKTLQVMTAKGSVIRSDERPHRYTPAKPQEQTQDGLLKDLARRAFGGSARKMLIRAVETGEMTGEELGEIRKLIDQLRKQKGGAR
jgi:BlaI family transcriptional regulator, penicillinase repressor